MNTNGVTLRVIGGLAFAALIFGGWKFYSATRTKEALAAADRRQEAMRSQIATWETRLGAAAKRAGAIESDNALLSSAFEKVRAVKTAAKAAPVSREIVEERFKQARLLAENGDPEAALRELLWCYDEGFPRVGGSRKATQMNAVVAALAKLGERYPAAQSALRERFEKARQRLLSSTDDSDAISELSSLARALKDERAMLALYDQIPSGDRRRQRIAIYAFDQFVEVQRYQDALPGRPFSVMSSSFEMLTQERPLPQNVRDPEGMRKRQRDYAINSAATNIEALAGAGDVEHARVLAEKLLKYDGSPETRALVRKHIERAGRPELLNQLPK